MDLLKLDIEGAEETLFSSPSMAWLDRVKALVIETHGDDCLRAVDRAFEGRRVRRSQRGEKLVYVQESNARSS